jgi:hypothetical protein
MHYSGKDPSVESKSEAQAAEPQVAYAALPPHAHLQCACGFQICLAPQGSEGTPFAVPMDSVSHFPPQAPAPETEPTDGADDARQSIQDFNMLFLPPYARALYHNQREMSSTLLEMNNSIQNLERQLMANRHVIETTAENSRNLGEYVEQIRRRNEKTQRALMDLDVNSKELRPLLPDGRPSEARVLDGVVLTHQRFMDRYNSPI